MAHSANQIYRRCLEAQFPGFEVTALKRATTKGAMVGIVGIRGASKFGSGGIAVPGIVAASLCPRSEAETADLFDWVGEMANQLLGRIKLELGKRGLAMRATVPLVMEAADMQFFTRGSVSVFRLSDGPRAFTAWFDLDEGGFDDLAKVADDSLSPGQVILFD